MTDMPTLPITYGQVSFKRVIADGDHGNIQAERTLPIFVAADEVTVSEALRKAEQAAWCTVVAQVNEEINAAFEREDLPAPIYTGQRYHVARWAPDDSLLLIVPQGADVPGGAHFLRYGKGHRLPKARELAGRLLAHGSYTDCWDLADGDFSDLQARLDGRNAPAEE